LRHAILISGIRELQANDADGPHPTATKYQLPQTIHKFNLSNCSHPLNVPGFSTLKFEREAYSVQSNQIHTPTILQKLPRLSCCHH
jgi:hypothetical protein